MYMRELEAHLTKSLEKNFVKTVKHSKMTDPLEILNWYRNLYHVESDYTERGIMARAINDLFVKYKDVFQ